VLQRKHRYPVTVYRLGEESFLDSTANLMACTGPSVVLIDACVKESNRLVIDHHVPDCYAPPKFIRFSQNFM